MPRYFKLLIVNETLIQKAWSLLINGVENILTKNTISVSYEEMYRNAYLLSLHNQSEAIIERLQELITQHLIKRVRVHLLSQFNENFLKSFNDAFSDHQKSMKVISAVFNCYSQQRIHNLELTTFREQIINFDSICDHLRTILFYMITRDRTGEEIDRSVIKNICEALMDLGVYQEVFEKQFLSYSAEFYRIQSEIYLAGNNVLVYLKTVQDCLKEESHRAMLYLRTSAEKSLLKTLEIELIHKRMKNITEMNDPGVEYMLLNQQTDALTFVYNFFCQITNGLQMISQCITSYLDEQGKALMENRHAKGGITFIQSLIDLKDHYDELLHQSFNNDKLFKNLFTNKFIYLLNSDPKHMEYLASYIDSKMKVIKSTCLSKQQTENILDKAVPFFKFLQEKDMFEKYYKQNLAKRLLLRESNLHTENYVISKFKHECGFDYTSKLELMCKDISFSESFSAEFKRCMQSDKVDLNVHVLTTDSWPISCSKSNCVIPIAPMMAFNSFIQFYLSRHNGKLLNLQTQLGWADLNAIFYGSGEKIREHTLQVSTYQMCILMLFNNRDKLTFKEIKSETDIPEKYLVRALQSLTMGKQSQRVLNKFPKCGKIEGDDIFNVNDSFTSIKPSVKIGTVPVIREFENSKKTKIKDHENRKYDIEATIVRIMKFRKKMHHDDLIAVVTDQLKSRFLSDIKLVTNCIEALIERDYLARVKGDHKTYTYVA